MSTFLSPFLNAISSKYPSAPPPPESLPPRTPSSHVLSYTHSQMPVVWRNYRQSHVPISIALLLLICLWNLNFARIGLVFDCELSLSIRCKLCRILCFYIAVFSVFVFMDHYFVFLGLNRIIEKSINTINSAYLLPEHNGIWEMASNESLFWEDIMLYPLHPAHAPKLASIINAAKLNGRWQ